MDLRLENGFYRPGKYRGADTVHGLEELGQRVVMKLSVPRGSFALLPDYGSRLHELGREKRSVWESVAARYVAEALEGETDLRILRVAVDLPEAGRLKVDVELAYQGAAWAVSAFFGI